MESESKTPANIFGSKYHRSEIKMQRQIYPLTCLYVCIQQLDCLFQNGLEGQVSNYIVIQKKIGICFGNRQIADYFHDQTIFIKDCELQTIGRSLQGGQLPPQILADQLTLSRPGGAHYPHPLLPAPPDFQTLGHA